MQSLIKKISGRIYKPYVQWLISKPNTFRYKTITLRIPPGVFHPQYFHSTLLLIEFMGTLPLQNKIVLELGCGSGLLSCVAAKQNAHVTASDISLLAITTLTENALKNNLQIEIVLSDLFDNLQSKHFDYIFINPPYYPKNPNSEAEKAWYCGAEFQYFEKLFLQIPTYIHFNTNVFIILSDDCDIKQIHLIAGKYNLQLNSITKKKYWNGVEEIYRLTISVYEDTNRCE
ncbi:MAG TPA: methyltransferase [Chitinophagales bacterium]|nr:methyltransferase [Chitinophagales bacterium]